MNRRTIVMGGAAAAVVTPARAAEKVHKAIAIAGDRFRANGDEFHLSDVLAPSEYDLHLDTQPYFREAKAKFSDILEGNAVEINESGEPDRWRARQVTARRAGDTHTLQERLVEAGAARVKPSTDDHSLIDRLLVAEQAARREKKGLWALHAYRIFDATNANRSVGGFNLVEGVVTSAKAGRGRYYLNFGDDYREDFTATAPSRRGRRWQAAGLDLEALEGARIRVRGFVEWINGPSIELGHVKALERLD